MAEIQQVLRQGIAAARAGDKEKARRLLGQVVTHDKWNEKAWLWLSDVVQTDEQRKVCLENVLAINPRNALAKAGLKKLGVERIKPLPPTPVETKPGYDQAVPRVAHPKPERQSLVPFLIIVMVALTVLIGVYRAFRR